MNAIWKLPCIGISRAGSLQQTIDLENLVLGGWFSNTKQQQKPVNWLLYFILLLKSPSKCFLRTHFSPRMAQGLLVADICYSRCDTVVDLHPWLLPISITDPCSSSVNWGVSSLTFLMANWGLQGQILGPRSHRAPMAKLLLLCLSKAPWCQRRVLFCLKPNGAEISVSDQKSCISQSSLLLLLFLFKPISDHSQKTNDSNVTLLCELSYVPASPEQAFSEKVTNTDIIKSSDYFQLFPLNSGRRGAQCFTSVVYFTAKV